VITSIIAMDGLSEWTALERLKTRKRSKRKRGMAFYCIKDNHRAR
jgi:hypothetical protein